MKVSWALLRLGLVVFSLLHMVPIQDLSHFDYDAPVSTPTESTIRAKAQEIGDSRSFWAVDYDAEEYYMADAYLLAIGEYCYIYFEDLVISILGQQEASDRATLYRDEFDTNIYPRVTGIAGNPNGTLGDIDGDPPSLRPHHREPPELPNPQALKTIKHQ